jgi:histidinol phosphatase-like enzyme
MNLNWNLQDLLERTKAAQQLGYRVVITADEEGILVQYEKQLSKNLKFF